MNPRNKQKRILLAVVVSLIAIAGSFGEDSSAQENQVTAERRGRQIYFQGTSQSGKPVLAYLGDDALEVPASTLPCANCHGANGQGKPEGGVSPSNITQEALTKPYGVTHATGRKHPAYTSRGLELAISRGLDPGGNKLLPVMPRYSMSREDMSDLILYLGRLGKDADPGIDENKIVIGTLVPTRGSLAEMGQAIKLVTSAVFADVNAAGGIYNRRLELVVAETGDTPAATRANLERTLTATPVLAMTSSFIAGSEKEVLTLTSEKEIPQIGAFTLYPRAVPEKPGIFFLLSGVEDQARALIEFASKKPDVKTGGIFIVHLQNDYNKTVVEGMQQQSKLAGLPAAETVSYVAGGFDAATVVRQGKPLKRDAVFLLGSTEEALSFMREADKAAWYPNIFLSVGTSQEILKAPPGFDQRIFIPFPTTPTDHSAESISEFRGFMVKHKLPNTHVASQMLAYSAARILIESLKITGRDLSRERFVNAVESLYEYKTGLIPPITFGPNRRIGSLGAYVVTINLKDSKFEPASGFIDLRRTR